MEKVETVQDWIQGFERHIRQRFNRNISVVALEGEKILDIESVCKIVCSVSGVPLIELVGSSRERNIVAARHVAMMLAYQHVKCSLNEIGRYFGDKDHSTVINARQSIKDKLDINDAIVVPIYKNAETLINDLFNKSDA